ncbi:MAG: dihydropteroate synthase [Gemmatimonadales bacterium]|nr:MAG: dihydropteroate synthase [Gemmatimonadales bacterium]
MNRAPSRWDGAEDAGWRIRGGVLSLKRPLVMGILNLTPDSFSDGGELSTVDRVLRRAERHLDEGAALLDVGGESTRPGADEVPVAEEIRRVVPAIEAVARRWSVPISVDTRRAEVARAALEAGAHIVNDVSGFEFDPELAGVTARAGAGAVLMHMRGTPQTMAARAEYPSLMEDLARELGEAARRGRNAGLPLEAIVLDPGLGFAKTAAQSLQIIRDLDVLLELGFPLLIGPSRKRFLGEVLDRPPAERVTGTAVACALALLGGARIFRVHDVRATLEALQVATAVRTADPQEGRGVKQETDSGERHRGGLTPGRKARTTR